MLCAGFWVGNPVLITQATPRLLGGQKNATLNFCSTTLGKVPRIGDLALGFCFRLTFF